MAAGYGVTAQQAVMANMMNSGMGGSPAWKTLLGNDRGDEYERLGYSPEALFLGQVAQPEYLNHYDRQYGHYQFPRSLQGKITYLPEQVMGLFGMNKNSWLHSEQGFPIRRVNTFQFGWQIFKFNQQPFELESEEGVARTLKVGEEAGSATLYRRAQAIFVEHNFFNTFEGIKLFGMQLKNMANNLSMTIEMLVIGYIMQLEGQVFKFEYESGARYLPVDDMVELILDENDKFAKALKTFDGFDQLAALARQSLEVRNCTPTILMTTPKIKKYIRGVGEALDFQKMGPAGPALAKVSPDSIKQYDGMSVKFIQPYISDNTNRPYDPFLSQVVFGQFFTMFGEDPNTIAIERGKYRSSQRTIKIHNQTIDRMAEIRIRDAVENLTMWEEYIQDGKKFHAVKGSYTNNNGNVFPYSIRHGNVDLFGSMGAHGYQFTPTFGCIDRQFVTDEMFKKMVHMMDARKISKEKFEQEVPTLKSTAKIEKAVIEEQENQTPPIEFVVPQPQENNNNNNNTDNVQQTQNESGNRSFFSTAASYFGNFGRAAVTAAVAAAPLVITSYLSGGDVQSSSHVLVSLYERPNVSDTSTILTNISKNIADTIPSSSASVHAKIVRAAKTAFKDKPELIRGYLEKTAENIGTLGELGLEEVLTPLVNAAEQATTREGRSEFESKLRNYSGNLSSSIPETAMKIKGFKVIDAEDYNPEKHILVSFNTKLPTEAVEESILDYNNLDHHQTMEDLQTGQYIKPILYRLDNENHPVPLSGEDSEYMQRFKRLNSSPEMLPVHSELLVSLMNAYISKEFLIFCIEHDILFPFGFIIPRPWNQWTTAKAVMGKMGAETGIVAIFNEDMMFGDDVSVKTHTLHFTLYVNPVIYNPYAFSFIPNIVTVAYHTGGNAKFYQSADIREAKRARFEPVHPMERDNIKAFPSIFPILTLYNDEELNPVIDLRRNFPTDDKNYVRPHFITTKANMDEWGFESLLGMKHPANPKVGRSNMICSIATHLVYDPTQDAITKPIIGRDCLGKNIGQGCMETLLLKGGERDGVLKDMGYDAIA